jgi:hypothetical protein
MTNEELIIVARSHCADMPKDSGESWATLKNLTRVKLVDAVFVSFESDKYPKKIVIMLERESGKFLASRLAPVES